MQFFLCNEGLAQSLPWQEPTNEASAETKLAFAMPCEEEEDKVKRYMKMNIWADRTLTCPCVPEGEDDGHPSARLVNKILELFPNARIHKTAGRGFIYHSDNIKVNATSVPPMKKYPEIED